LTTFTCSSQDFFDIATPAEARRCHRPSVVERFIEPTLFDNAGEASAFEYFLRLSVEDVRSRARDEVRWSGGGTWSGLLRLMERRGYEQVVELGAAAARAWATQLAIVRGRTG
jgi:hypothetical protein